MYFNKNSRVQVLYADKSGDYKDCIGLYGTVVGYFKSQISVEVDDKYNDASAKGLYWFRESQLKLINIETNESEENNMMVNGEYKVAMVEFVEGYDRKQRQFALYNEANAGDYVLCDSAGKYVLGIITGILSYEEAKENHKLPTKEVICVCDFNDFNKRKELRAKAVELKSKMDKRIEELKTSQIYEMFAEKDETLKSLLDEYKIVVG